MTMFKVDYKGDAAIVTAEQLDSICAEAIAATGAEPEYVEVVLHEGEYVEVELANDPRQEAD